jgi:type I restriction enzyme, S subunit
MSSLVSYGQLRPAFIGALGVIFTRLLSPGSSAKLKRLDEVIEFSDSGIWGGESVDPISDFRVFRVSDFKGDFQLNFSSPPHRSIPEHKQEKFRLKNGDILVVKSSGSAKQVVSGRVAVFDSNADTSYAASNFLLRLRPSADVDPRYLAYALGSPPIRETIADKVKTMTYPNLSFKIYRTLIVPVIPLHDQHRVAEFLRAFFERRDLPDLPDYLDEQRRIVARIEELSAKIEEARLLRQRTIEETEALLGARLGDVYSELALHNPVFPLGSLTSHVLDGPHQTPQYLSQGIPFVTVKNMVTGALILNDLNYVSEHDHRLFSKRCRAEKGDVLYSKDGATRGKPCLVDTDREFSFFVSVALIKPLRNRLYGPYLVHLLNSNWIRDRMKDKSRGDMIPHIVLKEIKAFPIPLPDLAEQRRIVAYLDDLQAKVDTLKTFQEESEAELNALMPSILSRAFAGEL